MSKSAATRQAGIRERLDAVIHGGHRAKIPELVKTALVDAMRDGFTLPDRFYTTRSDA